MNTRSTLSFVTPLCLLLSGAAWSNLCRLESLPIRFWWYRPYANTDRANGKRGEFNVGLTMSNDYQHYGSLQLMEWLEMPSLYPRARRTLQ